MLAKFDLGLKSRMLPKLTIVTHNNLECKMINKIIFVCNSLKLLYFIHVKLLNKICDYDFLCIFFVHLRWLRHVSVRACHGVCWLKTQTRCRYSSLVLVGAWFALVMRASVSYQRLENSCHRSFCSWFAVYSVMVVCMHC